MCGLCWRIALRVGSMGQERQSHFGRTQGRCQLSGIGDASVKWDYIVGSFDKIGCQSPLLPPKHILLQSNHEKCT